MQFIGRSRYLVQQKNPILVGEVISKIKAEVQRLGFVVTSKEESLIFYRQNRNRYNRF